MATRLRKLRIGKVALCFQGANPHAEVLLYKAAAPVEKDGMNGMDDDANEPPPMTLEERQQSRQLWQQWFPLWWDFCDTVSEIFDGDEDDLGYGAILLQSIAQFQSQATTLLTSLGLVGKAQPLLTILADVQKTGAVMAAGRKKRLQDAIAALQAILDEAAPKAADTTQKGARVAEKMVEGGTLDVAKLREAEAQVVALEKDNAVLKAELRQLKMTPEEQEAEYAKSLPEHIRKEREVYKVENAQLKEDMRIEKDARQRQEYIEKTAAYRQVGITPDHHNILKAIDTLPEQERTELLRILKSADAVIRSSKLFVPAGSDGSGAGTTAGEQFMTQAEALVKDKSAATIQEAMEMVNKSHPALYAEYQDEQLQKSRVK